MRHNQLFRIVRLFGLSLSVIWGVYSQTAVAQSIRDYQLVVRDTAVDATAQKHLRVDCPKGKAALGAGWSVLDPTSAILDGRATYFEPSFDGSHWLVNAQNNSTFAPKWKLRLRVICARVRP